MSSRLFPLTYQPCKAWAQGFHVWQSYHCTWAMLRNPIIPHRSFQIQKRRVWRYSNQFTSTLSHSNVPKMDVQSYQLASNCEWISHQTPNNIRTRDGSHFVPDETLRHFGSQGGQRRWIFFYSRFLKQRRFEFGRVLGLFLLLRLNGTLRHCSTNCFSFGSRTLKPCPRRRW